MLEVHLFLPLPITSSAGALTDFERLFKDSDDFFVFLKSSFSANKHIYI